MSTLYRTIVADPPWEYNRGFLTGPGAWGRSAGADGSAFKPKALPYPSLTVQEIAALSVSDLADANGANLFLWTTNRYLESAFEIVRSWGAKFCQTVVWSKTRGRASRRLRVSPSLPMPPSSCSLPESTAAVE